VSPVTRAGQGRFGDHLAVQPALAPTRRKHTHNLLLVDGRVGSRNDQIEQVIRVRQLPRLAVSHVVSILLSAVSPDHFVEFLDRGWWNPVARAFGLPPIKRNKPGTLLKDAADQARTIVQTDAFERYLGHGAVRASAFPIDMNKAFEDFVVVAMRDRLRLDTIAFPQGAAGRDLHLDEARRIRLKPDISWWSGPTCTFVGDIKYKRIDVQGLKHADLYQLLAYCVAIDLSGGLLIYAAGEAEPFTHRVVMLGKELDIVTLDLAGSPAEILAHIARLCARVQKWRDKRLLVQRGVQPK
jgi:hypothetical protein